MIDFLIERYGAKKVSEEYVRVKDIEVGMMPRRLKEEWVKQLVETIEAGRNLPPVRVVRKRGGKYELLDGFHRLEAYRRSEVLMIPAEVWKVDEEYIPAVKIAFNLEHGLPLTREEKFENFKIMAEKYKEWSNHDFAEALGVSVRTIERWKQKLGLSQEIRKLTEEDKKKIVEMAEEGHSTREIARELGISQPRVIQILEETSKEERVGGDDGGDKDRHLADLINSEPIVHKSEDKEVKDEQEEIIFNFGDEEVVDELDDEEDDLEEIEREVREGLKNADTAEGESKKKGEKLFRVLDDALKVMSLEHYYEALKEYVNEELTVTEKHILAERIRLLIPRFHEFIGFLISGGVRREG